MILLDSSFLIAYRNEGDAHHARAAALMAKIVAGEFGRALLLEYVFLEVVTVLAARKGLQAATSAGRELLDAQEIDFVPCSPIVIPAFETFRSQVGTKLSLTDAALVVVARARQSPQIATFDRDFAQVQGMLVVP